MTLPIQPALPPRPLLARVAARTDPNVPVDLLEKAQHGDVKARAQVAWLDLTAAMGPANNLHDASDSPLKRATAWGYGQAMTAALDLAHVTGDESAYRTMVHNLDRYRVGDGYAPTTDGTHGGGQRYYDDNAWIGLALAQGAQQSKDPALRKTCLQHAEQVFKFLQSGMDAPGGMIWHEGQSPATFNTCTEGPAMELGLRLYMLTSNKQYLQSAQQLHQDVQRQGLQDANGLFADHVLASNFKQRSDDIYSYNQGTPIGADVLFYRITGDHQYLQEAQKTATAALQHFDEKHLFEAAPGFNAILLRNLLLLDAAAPDPKLRQAVEQYAQQAWEQGRDGDTGLYNVGGIGHYGDGQNMGLLDQSAFVQVNALLAWSPKDLSSVS